MDTIKNPLNTFQSIDLIPENINLNNYYEPQLLRKDWTQIDTLTDDGGIEVDINFTIMAVGLCMNCFFPAFTMGLSLMSINTLRTAKINGQKVNVYFQYSLITFVINLFNGQSSKIHVKYKSIRYDVSLLYNTHQVGIAEYMRGRRAKYTLIVPDKFVVVTIDNDTLIDRGNGKYSWQGIVPNVGFLTTVSVTPKFGKWYAVSSEFIRSNGYFYNTKLRTKKRFFSGNNKILSYNVKSSKSNKIDGQYIIDKGDNFEINFKNLQSSECFFQQIIEFENRSKGNWECYIEPIIPEDEKRDKRKLKTLAEKIIRDNKNKKLLPHVKIGKRVHQNINYHLSFVGKQITTIQILECKYGVCHNFTILYNTLLNSIGIQCNLLWRKYY